MQQSTQEPPSAAAEHPWWVPDALDVAGVVGVASLFAGLWLWFALAVALTVVGGLVVAVVLALFAARARHEMRTAVAVLKPGRR